MENKQQVAWGYNPVTANVKQQTQPLPALGKNQILVANRAIGINPVDWKFIQANPLAWAEGHIPGVDGSGIVMAVGEGVDAALVGRSVAYHAALKENGSFATHTVLQANRVMMLPEGMSFDLAAALPCPMLTAWQAAEKIPVKAGQPVLVAGLGAVNKILVQLLRQRGFVVDVLSKSLPEAQAAQWGIRQVLRDLAEVQTTYFAAFDAVGGDHAALLVPHLKANGHVICILDRIPQPIDPAFTRTISYHEIALGALHDFGDDEAWQQLMQDGEHMMAHIVAGELTVDAPLSLPFDAMPKALTHSETSKQKTVVVVE